MFLCESAFRVANYFEAVLFDHALDLVLRLNLDGHWVFEWVEFGDVALSVVI